MICPRCNVGQDTDEDGNCTFCARRGDAECIRIIEHERGKPAAQEHMFQIYEKKRKLEEQESALAYQINELIDEARVLLSTYPGLQFSRPKEKS